LASVTVRGHKVGGVAKISCETLNAVEPIQRNGNVVKTSSARAAR
jgi:hypothetical protein